MEEDSATAQSVMRGIDRAAERLGLDRPNLGLDKQLVRILLLLGAFVFLLQIRPQQPNAVQVSALPGLGRCSAVVQLKLQLFTKQAGVDQY